MTMNEIRQNGFMIVGLCGVVSHVISKCRECRKLRACPHSQKMSDLPWNRLEPSPRFTYGAVDLFGPFIRKVEGSLRGTGFCLLVWCVERFMWKQLTL